MGRNVQVPSAWPCAQDKWEGKLAELWAEGLSDSGLPTTEL